MILNLTHDDTDGFISSFVAKEAFGYNNVLTEYISYYNIDLLYDYLNNFNINNFELILLSDINVKNYNDIKFLNKISDKVMLIDHHMDTFINMSNFKFENYINKDFCSALNLYKYLNLDDSRVKEFVKYTNIFDMYKIDNIKYKEAERFNNIISILNKRNIINNLKSMSFEEFMEYYNKSVGIIIDNEFEEQMKSFKLLKEKDGICIWNYTKINNLYMPNINELIKELKYDSKVNIVLYNYNETSKYIKVSCRANVDIDLPYIISQCGFKGGGHKKAAGLTLFNKEDIKRLFDYIYKECDKIGE